MDDPGLRIREKALPPAQFARLLRRVRALGRERLRQTYQTTFWYPLEAPPSNVVEAVVPALRQHVRPRGAVGVEWWLSRMRATDVQVDFHQDRDERLALATGKLVHPLVSSVLFLNRVRGGALAVTSEPPCEENPALAPERFDCELAAPRPNRLAVFDGRLTHGVLDANNAIPTGKLPGPARLRLAVIVNWWHRRPKDVPTFEEAGVYRSLALPRSERVPVISRAAEPG